MTALTGEGVNPSRSEFGAIRLLWLLSESIPNEIDVGGAVTLPSRSVASRHPHLRFKTFDPPPVRVHAQRAIDAAGLSESIQVVSGDFFVDPVPTGDVVTMGNVLHDWNPERKPQLIRKAYDALPDGVSLMRRASVSRWANAPTQTREQLLFYDCTSGWIENRSTDLL